MLNVYRIACNMLQENCYIVSDDSKECVIIDCGALYDEEREEIKEYIKQHQLKPVCLVATHGHIDHHFGDPFIYKEYGLKPYVHKADRYLMEQLPAQSKTIAGFDLKEVMPEVGKYLTADDQIKFGSYALTVIETPGHSRGGVFYYCAKEHIGFSGDTLFHNSIGRTDFEGGSMFQMIQSLRTLSQLPDQTRVYPGHGESTTIGEELANNPYMDR